ncbi:MAG: hypothetical protein EZS28_031726 [Streblomastix strix]|uniref:Uncharacterized protein n=1 Tax=Streblomastix strix TaxID=222440 RepID=A0A5J4UQU1_9EUKA|nr:MAG: hypothetical protein EZS28_031726 [Streblomastix strix]
MAAVFDEVCLIEKFKVCYQKFNWSTSELKDAAFGQKKCRFYYDVMIAEKYIFVGIVFCHQEICATIEHWKRDEITEINDELSQFIHREDGRDNKVKIEGNYSLISYLHFGRQFKIPAEKPESESENDPKDDDQFKQVLTLGN